MSRGKRAATVYLLVILLFLGLALVYTRPLAAEPADHVSGNSNDMLLNIYIVGWTSHTLGINLLDFFNTTMFYPNSNTLVYTDPQVMTSIIALPAFWLTGNLVLAYNWVFIFSFVLGALGAFLLVDHLVGDRLAALAGSLLFGFPLYKLAHITQIQLLLTGFIPLAFLCLHLYTERAKARYAVLFGLFTVCVFLSSWGYGFFFAFAALVYLFVLAVLRRKQVIRALAGRSGPGPRRAVIRWLGVLVAVSIVAGVVLAPLALPYLRAQKRDPNFKRSLAEVDAFGADVEDFLVASPTSLVWGSATKHFYTDPSRGAGPPERALFTGLIPLALAVLGIVFLARRRDRNSRFLLWFYVVLGVLGAVLALGPSLHLFGHHYAIFMPYRLLYHLFPGFKSIRTPSRMIVLTVLSLSVLGGFGIARIREMLSGRASRAVWLAVAAGVVVLLGLEMMSTSVPAVAVPPARASFPPAYRWLATREGDAPTAVLPFGADIANATQMEAWRLYYNTANWKKTVNGYSGYTPASYAEAMTATAGFPSPDSLAFLRRLTVRYALVEGDRYDRTVIERTLELARADPDFHLVGVFDNDYLFELR